MSIIKKKYDKNYYENILYKGSNDSQRNKKRIKEILRFKKDGRLFEIGCAKGEFLRTAEKYFNVSGIDISGYAINSAKKYFDGKVSVLDIRKAKLDENKYDVVAGFNLLEHMKNPDKVIKKIYDSLKKDSIFIGSVPNKSWLIGRAFTSFSNFIDRTHCSTFTPKIWNRLFTKSGFNKIIFFGEIMPTRNHCIYVKGRFWNLFSMNMVFVCIK